MIIGILSPDFIASFKSNESFRKTHRELVEDELYQGANSRQPEWTESIAAGSKGFIESISHKFGALAKGRKLIKESENFQLREPSAPYNAVFTTQKEDIGPQNRYFWSRNHV